MGVRSKRLWGPTQLPVATTVTLYTVPSGETALVKWITVANSNAAVQRVELAIQTTAATATGFRMDLAALEVRQLEVWWALPAGEIIRALGTPGHAALRISGYGAELEGAAD
jgi:hypothetical protein